MPDTTNSNATEVVTEINSLLEARYPNVRRTQRALIRLAELAPNRKFGSRDDRDAPGFIRIYDLGTGTEATTAKSSGLALKAEPIVVRSEAKAGGTPTVAGKKPRS